MYTAALKEMKKDLHSCKLSQLSKKHGVPVFKLTMYWNVLKTIQKEEKSAVWSDSKKEFLKLYMEDAKGEHLKKFDLYKEAGEILGNHSLHSVRLIYNRKVKYAVPQTKLTNTKIVMESDPLPKNRSRLSEEFFTSLTLLIDQFEKQNGRYQELKEDVAELAAQIIKLTQNQKKVVRFLKASKKKDKPPCVQKTIIDFARSGGVVRVE